LGFFGLLQVVRRRISTSRPVVQEVLARKEELFIGAVYHCQRKRTKPGNQYEGYWQECRAKRFAKPKHVSSNEVKSTLTSNQLGGSGR
jgi:hypothetical protein